MHHEKSILLGMLKNSHTIKVLSVIEYDTSIELNEYI